MKDYIKNNGIFAKGADDEDINKAEKELGLSFSKEYKAYLSSLALGTIDGHEFTGITKNKRLNVVDVTEAERKKNPTVPKTYYVVEKTNVDGVVIWQDKSGKVYESYENGDVDKVADSVFQYIKDCVE